MQPGGPLARVPPAVGHLDLIEQAKAVNDSQKVYYGIQAVASLFESLKDYDRALQYYGELLEKAQSVISFNALEILHME